MSLSLIQTRHLYTAYIQYYYYLVNTLKLSLSHINIHYPLQCQDNMRIYNETPVTVQLLGLCYTEKIKKKINMIYSEEVTEEYMLYR